MNLSRLRNRARLRLRQGIIGSPDTRPKSRPARTRPRGAAQLLWRHTRIGLGGYWPAPARRRGWRTGRESGRQRERERERERERLRGREKADGNPSRLTAYTCSELMVRGYYIAESVLRLGEGNEETAALARSRDPRDSGSFCPANTASPTILAPSIVSREHPRVEGAFFVFFVFFCVFVFFLSPSSCPAARLANAFRQCLSDKAEATMRTSKSYPSPSRSAFYRTHRSYRVLADVRSPFERFR
jgi:hypothetical protein